MGQGAPAALPPPRRLPGSQHKEQGPESHEHPRQDDQVPRHIPQHMKPSASRLSFGPKSRGLMQPEGPLSLGACTFVPDERLGMPYIDNALQHDAFLQRA